MLLAKTIDSPHRPPFENILEAALREEHLRWLMFAKVLLAMCFVENKSWRFHMLSVNIPGQDELLKNEEDKDNYSKIQKETVTMENQQNPGAPLLI